jgi:hypothetical protein
LEAPLATDVVQMLRPFAPYFMVELAPAETSADAGAQARLRSIMTALTQAGLLPATAPPTNQLSQLRASERVLLTEGANEIIFLRRG